MGKAKDGMMATLFGMIIRTLTLIVLSFLKIGMWSLILATAINIVFVTCHNLKHLKRYLN